MATHPDEGFDQRQMSRWDLMFGALLTSGLLGLGVIVVSKYGFGENLNQLEVAGRIFLAGIASFVPAVAATVNYFAREGNK